MKMTQEPELPALPEPIEYVVDPAYTDIVGDDDGEPAYEGEALRLDVAASEGADMTDRELLEAAAKAVLAERERCAKIADFDED